jgi:hypothetical protein
MIKYIFHAIKHNKHLDSNILTIHYTANNSQYKPQVNEDLTSKRRKDKIIFKDNTMSALQK